MQVSIKIVDDGPIGLTNKQLIRGSEHAAGHDICASEDYLIRPEETAKIKTGIFCEFWWTQSPKELLDGAPPRPIVCEFGERSGLASRGIFLGGGKIDSDYRGEWQVVLYNSTADAFVVRKGDRIAQAIFKEPGIITRRVTVGSVELLSHTQRGGSGFGSTGHSDFPVAKGSVTQ